MNRSEERTNSSLVDWLPPVREPRSPSAPPYAKRPLPGKDPDHCFRDSAPEFSMFIRRQMETI